MFTAQEAELYDRQIRLWGAAAQQRMRDSAVLVYGLNALGAEVAKNAVLAGTNVIIGDAASVGAADIGSQFFLTAEDIGKNRAEASLARLSELNRLVETSALSVALTAAPEDAFRKCRLAVLCDGSVDEQLRAGRRLRALGVPYMAASLHGFFAAMFVDLGAAYKFSTERHDAKPAPGPTAALQELSFPDVDSAIASPWVTDAKQLRRMAKQLSLHHAWLVYMKASVAAGADAAPSALAAEASRLVAELGAAAPATASAAAALPSAGTPPPPPPASSSALPLDTTVLDALLTQRGAVSVPVACILGGVIANQLVAVLAGRGRPLHNVVVLDAMASVCVTTLAPGPTPELTATASAEAPRAAAAAAAAPAIGIDDDDDEGGTGGGGEAAVVIE